MSVLPSALQPFASLPRHPKFVDASNSQKKRDGSTHRGHPRNRRCPEQTALSLLLAARRAQRCTSINCTPEDTRARRPFFCEGPFFVQAALPRLSCDEESIGVRFSFFSLFFSSWRGYMEIQNDRRPQWHKCNNRV